MHGDREHSLDGLVLDNKYELVRRIGAGGMGEVYRGKQLSTGGRVAVKIMDATDRPAKTLARFKYEAETTAQLTHPNTVRILDFGADQDLFFLVMEYLSGTDLTRFLRPGGQSDPFVSHVLFQIASSLTEAHSRGVIHRDIKPNNVMLLQHVGHPSFVKVIDFGIARAIAGPGHGTRGILGTIGYIAPEAVHDQAQPDTRTDLYSLGCVAYELVTGRLPFDGITHHSAPLDVLEAHMSGTPRHVLDVKPSVDAELAEIVMSLIARDPGDRPATAGDVVLPLHSIRSRVSEGVVFGADIPPATRIEAEDERDHENVVNLRSEQLTSIPPQGVKEEPHPDVPRGAPTLADGPNAMKFADDTLSAPVELISGLSLDPEYTVNVMSDVTHPATTEDDESSISRRQLGESGRLDRAVVDRVRKGVLFEDHGIDATGKTDDAIPAESLIEGADDRVERVDPRGSTEEAVPAHHLLAVESGEPESQWSWSEEPHEERTKPATSSSSSNVLLPMIVLSVAIGGIAAWFLVGR